MEGDFTHDSGEMEFDTCNAIAIFFNELPLTCLTDDIYQSLNLRAQKYQTLPWSVIQNRLY